MISVLYIFILLRCWRLQNFFACADPHKRYRTSLKKPAAFCRQQGKPDWVKPEIIRLKALMPDAGCRVLALVFNRRHAHARQMSVSKSHVATLIKKHQYEILEARRKIKQRVPPATPANYCWQMDLTGKQDVVGGTHNILGIIDAGTRACLVMKAVQTKATIVLLRILLNAIEQHGKPANIRTDNEAVFASRLFRLAMRLLNIRHETSELHCPWQNGRIERLFGTLKQKLDQISVSGMSDLNSALHEFRFWYNAVRPHQHLYGRTPAEVWARRDVFADGFKAEQFVCLWGGLLTGFYLRR